MKLVCTADWHAHNFTDFSKTFSVVWSEKSLRYEILDGEPNEEDLDVKEMNSRLFNILNGICDMRDYCLTNNITDVLFGGDMFHHRGTIDVTVYNAIYKTLDSYHRLGITIHAIAGNHDQTDASIVPISAIHAFDKIIHVIEKPELFAINNQSEQVEVVAIPYSKNKKFVLESMKYLRDMCEDPRQAILLCHLGIDGGLVGSGMYMMSDEYTLKDLMYDKWKSVVIGHYHQPQILSYNTFYCGTPVQNNFGDELKGKDGYNGFFVIDTDRRWDIEFVPIIAPRFITVSSVEELKEMSPETLKTNYVRVKSKANQASEIQEELKEMLNEDVSQGVRLELEKDYVQEHRSDIGVTQSPEETLKTYAKEHWGDKDTLSSLVDCGLSILHEALTGGKQ